MKKAFTLAEVLITLGIIGVVAAMTLPVITQKVDKQVTVSKLKKSLATMYEIVRLSEADNGEVWTWDFSEESYEHAFVESNFFKKYFEPYIKKVGNYGEKSVQQTIYDTYNIDGVKTVVSTTERIESGKVWLSDTLVVYYEQVLPGIIVYELKEDDREEEKATVPEPAPIYVPVPKRKRAKRTVPASFEPLAAADATSSAATVLAGALLIGAIAGGLGGRGTKALYDCYKV